MWEVAIAVVCNTCRALFSLQALTVSAFCRKRKIGALEQVQQNTKYQAGKVWCVPERLFAMFQEYTFLAIKAVTDLKLHLFRAKKRDIESGQLPPCEDCLLMHTRSVPLISWA